MGHCTELKCKLKLKKDIPESVLSILKRVLIKKVKWKQKKKNLK